jgi:4-O-beta-D-mannosyl-D-glucose phosphorylase
MDDDGTVFIYYASSDTRMHVVTSSLDRLLDYVMNTAPDGYTSAETTRRLTELIDRNLAEMVIKAATPGNKSKQ